MQDTPTPEFLAAQLRKPSGEFAPVIGEMMNEINEFLYDFMVECMNLKPDETILEIGFGNGKFFEKLFTVSDSLKVSGIDYSKEMAASARDLNAERIKSGNLIINEGSSDALPFDDGMFDKVLSSMVIYFWEKPVSHLKEIHRVLKPGGMLFTGIRSRESMMQFPFTTYGFKLYETDEWCKILEENQFEIISANTKSQDIEVDEKMMQLESICIAAKKVG
jgi:ubiquinone/menaquinone biosynthesis C-methylase UbiE